mmetsp:Transcript_492/g.944  ORF Transcript_492/g.944 Transcript_492/m.944 type:complete len:595 (-) Transcript_492:22-1806(-)
MNSLAAAQGLLRHGSRSVKAGSNSSLHPGLLFSGLNGLLPRTSSTACAAFSSAAFRAEGLEKSPAQAAAAAGVLPRLAGPTGPGAAAAAQGVWPPLRRGHHQHGGRGLCSSTTAEGDEGAPAVEEAHSLGGAPDATESEAGSASSSSSASASEGEPAAKSGGEKEELSRKRRLFVTNLPYSTTEDELKDYLSSQGAVLSANIKYRMVDGVKQSRGFGTVEFAAAADAESAMERLDGASFGGRQIKVRKDNVSKLNRELEATKNVEKKVFVDSLHPSLIWQDVKDHFQQTGNVHFVHMMWDATRMHRQAVVEFGSAEEAQDAVLELNSSVLQGQGMLVRPYDAEDMKEKEPQGQSVFVNYIDADVELEDLNAHVLRVAEIEKSKIFLHKNGDYKQGIVKLRTSADAKNVIEQLNRSFLNERMIRVRAYIDDPHAQSGTNESKYLSGHYRERRVRKERGTSGTGAKLFLDNLNSRVEWQEVKDHLRLAGSIVHVKVMWAESGKCKQAIAEVESQEDAQNIVAELNNSTLFGDTLYIREFSEQEAGGEQSRRRGGPRGGSSASFLKSERDAEEAAHLSEQHVFDWGEGVDNISTNRH